MRNRRLRVSGWSWWACVGLVVGLPASGQAQDGRFELGAGFAVSGPARTYAEYGVFTGAVRILKRGPWTAAVEGAAMLGGGQGPLVSCGGAVPATVTTGGGYTFQCDARDLGPVGRLGLMGRFAPWAGTTPYLIAAAGVWGSSWTRGYGEGRLTADPYGPLLEAGIGMPLPDTHRRTVVEARFALFGQGQTGGVTPVRAGSVRLAVHRRW